MARVGGDVPLAGGRVSRQQCRQAENGRARNRARARLNSVAQGQRCGRCRVRRRAERVSRPAIEKNRRRRVLVVTTCSPRPMRAVQRARLWAITCTASQAPPRWYSFTPPQLSKSSEKVRTNWLAEMSHSLHGECDIEPERANETASFERPAGGADYVGSGGRVDGSELTPHARRMLAAYQDRGAASLAHGHRGHRRSTPHPRR